MAGPTDVPITPQALIELIEEAIVTQRLVPGERLASERQLAEQYGVSRPVVREVLRRLQERGLIVVQPGRGSFVRRLQPTEGRTSLEFLVRRGEVTVRELVTARQMLEAETSSLAAEQHTDADATQLRALLEAFDASRDIASGVELDIAFHEAIAIASRNTVLQIMFGAIRPLIKGMVLRSLTDREIRRMGAPVHHDILDAIVARNAAGAREAMLHHLRLSEDLYGPDIDRPLHEILYDRAVDQPEVSALLRRAGDVLAP
ncbi:FadR/GntR family transcriptional regulator [Streptomyces sp. NPDC050418]|uniref:FadR/GntR family transcriptional regulator n=1 Tax=Streptomyces sp. NPDC050418 TaxID=3365612 RepID=UPI0037A8822E